MFFCTTLSQRAVHEGIHCYLILVIQFVDLIDLFAKFSQSVPYHHLIGFKATIKSSTRRFLGCIAYSNSTMWKIRISKTDKVIDTSRGINQQRGYAAMIVYLRMALKRALQPHSPWYTLEHHGYDSPSVAHSAWPAAPCPHRLRE